MAEMLQCFAVDNYLYYLMIIKKKKSQLCHFFIPPDSASVPARAWWKGSNCGYFSGIQPEAFLQ